MSPLYLRSTQIASALMDEQRKYAILFAATIRCARKLIEMEPDEPNMAKGYIVDKAINDACQGVSPNDEPCDYPATVPCATCSKWFCDAHAEDEEWHPCMLPPGEEGGEA